MHGLNWIEFASDGKGENILDSDADRMTKKIPFTIFLNSASFRYFPIDPKEGG